MSKIDDVRKAMTEAMKAGQKERKDALSILLSDLKAKFIDKREELTEEEENTVVLKEIKQAQETLDSAPADRTDIIDECRFRMSVYKEFAPVQMNEEQIRKTLEGVLSQLGISAPAAKDKGVVMKNLMPLVKGKADGGLVNKIVSQMLKTEGD